MTIYQFIALAVFFFLIALAAAAWARGIADEPPPTEAEKRQWPGWGDDHAR